ncbi:MAG: FmdB family zinc ribbon protein [Burkholderiaceae bacterium]|jgi:putative FmdB family regulatory protein
MPIYAYKCGTCGHTKDVLQKISDAPLTVCPECGAATFTKQVTAAGFQLKGSGWYATDFRDSGKGAGKSAPASEPAAEGAACATAESGKDGASAGAACAGCTAPAAAAPQA